MKTYEIDLHHIALKRITVKANDRKAAIEKASQRADRLGLQVTRMAVPFLEGDPQSETGF